jgi:hypothetical protein
MAIPLTSELVRNVVPMSAINASANAARSQKRGRTMGVNMGYLLRWYTIGGPGCGVVGRVRCFLRRIVPHI